MAKKKDLKAITQSMKSVLDQHGENVDDPGNIDVVQEEQINAVLAIEDNYTVSTRLYNKYCNEHGYGFFDGLIPYSLYLEQEHDGKRYSARSYNVKVAAVKNRIRHILETYPHKYTSDDLLKMERILRKVKPKTVNNVKVREGKYAPIEEIRQLIDTARTRDRKLAPQIEFLFVTGVRVSEMLNILVSDINMKPRGNQAHIRILGKGRKERTVYCPKKMIQDIMRMYNSERYLFEHYSRTAGDVVQYSRRSVSQRIKACSAASNITEISAHGLRHSYATHLLNDKHVSVRKVADLLGHSSTAITDMIYNGISASPEDAITDL